MICDVIKITYVFGQTFTLKPIFDVHLGNKHCDINAFKNYLSDSDENTLFIGGGDLLDSIITKDIKRYRKSDDATEGDAIIDEQIQTMYDLLSPYREHIIGLGEGNHEDVILQWCGTNPINRLCALLSTKEHTVKYLGYSFLINLLLHTKNGNSRSIITRGHHGWGGGSRTRGGNITKYERDMGKWDADIYLYGHVHQKQIDEMPRLGLSGKRLIARNQVLAICGTFLKTYSETSDPTYSEIKGFPPVGIGGISIKIKPRGKQWVDLKASL